MNLDGGNAAAHQETGESTPPDVMKNRAREELLAAGIELSRSKVNRKFVEFWELQPGGDLDAFKRYLARTLAQERGEWVTDPDHARVVSYADKTGEEAVKNVHKDRLREARRRGRGRTAA
jgi:hypothetical protein